MNSTQQKTKQFKVGDRVRCIDAAGPFDLHLGHESTVSAVHSGGRYISTDNGEWWWARRFELVVTPQFKAGDRVLCIDGHTGGTQILTGSEYVVAKINSIGTLRLVGQPADSWIPSRFELVVTPQFKAGDTVRLKSIPERQGVVVEPYSDGNVKLKMPNGSWWFRYPEELEFVAAKLPEITLEPGQGRTAPDLLVNGEIVGSFFTESDGGVRLGFNGGTYQIVWPR